MRLHNVLQWFMLKKASVKICKICKKSKTMRKQTNVSDIYT